MHVWRCRFLYEFHSHSMFASFVRLSRSDSLARLTHIHREKSHIVIHIEQHIRFADNKKNTRRRKTCQTFVLD